VEIEVPQEMGDTVKQDILASPTSVNLGELLPYYYTSSAKMSKMYLNSGIIYRMQDQDFQKLLAMVSKTLMKRHSKRD
jgi:hypothetical protein